MKTQTKGRQPVQSNSSRRPAFAAKYAFGIPVGSALCLAGAASAIAALIHLATPSNSQQSLLFATTGMPGPGVDSDAEGLADNIELQVGSSPLYGDTDGDGVSDFVEAVFGTLATNPTSLPSVEMIQEPRAKVLTYLEGEDFHIVVAVNVPDGDIQSIMNAGALLFSPQISGYTGPQVVDLNPLVLSGSIQSQSTSGSGSSTIYSSDSSFPKEILNVFTGTDGYAEFTIAFSATVSNALVGSVSYHTTTAVWDTTMASLASLPVTSQGPGSGAFKPLQPAALPPNWTPDSACFVSSAMIGVEFGAILVLQGVSAECLPQEGAVCNSVACQEMVGRFFRIVDPCSLGICQ